MDAIDKIIDRIKKAVRLANKTTEAGERETAIRLARNLAEKHGIAFSEVEADAVVADSAKQVEEDGFQSYDAIVDGRICGIIRAHFAVVTMLYLRHVGTTRKVKRTYFGSSLNIEIAKYVADILRREAQKAWRNVKKMEADGMLGFRLKRADYMAGFFWKIHKRLTEHPIRNDIDQRNAESKKAEELFDKYRQNNKVEDHKMRGGGDSADSASLYSGFMAADKIALNRPCGNGMPSAGAIGKHGVLGLRI